MALQQRLSRELANLLLSTPSYLNRPQVQRSRLQLFSSLLSRDIDSSEKKRRREDDCPSTKRTSIKQDVGSPTLAAAVSSLIGDKPYGVLLSALVCRLPDKLIRDVMPAQGPWSPQRAPEVGKFNFPQQKSNCPVFDDPCGESSCSFDPRAEKTLLSTGLYPRNWSRLQTRGLHASALKCGVGRGHSNGKSNRNKSQKAAKKPNNSKTRKGPREKKPSDQKFTSCEPDVGWKRHKCLGDSRGSDTCSVDKPQCTEKVGPTYRELEKSHEDKRMKAWKQSKSSSSDKCQPDDSWKESKTCTKSSESCSTGKPQCGGGKRSYSTLPRILLNFQSTRSLMSGGGLSRECNSGGGDNKDKSIGDVFKKEMQEIEECIAAAKCKIPMPKTDKSNGEGNSTKKGKK
ncbi:hypothetical protein TSAR_013413 [Trichomalopsis sarcophagae]|uniref:Uncharacterized protein n=1 Tax=Trichomalopsis sarcophagae TaxID=543379 RepID=A0A232EXZ6_9HYME|nr:hypothetical protein TSAR_013413 [Trichomalopsis sarcophagae]